MIERAARVGFVVLVSGFAALSPASARPYDEESLPAAAALADSESAESDSIVLVLPVRRSPSLLLLRASAPLAVAAALPPSAREAWAVAPPGEAATVLRLEGVDASAAGVPNGGTSGGLSADAGPGGDRISISGSKSFAVEVGRMRAATLSQGLDLSLRGRIAGDVDLSATLSDHALPFEPDGATRQLDDLDRVALSLRAPNGEATLGDFRLDAFPGEFARMSREVQGVRGGASLAGARWDVTAASAKGERRSAEFRGVEGKQGPYVLQSRAASSGGDGGIVTSSETVWLDGMKLRRGADADYVVDYGAGTITFTVRRPIAASSRIAIDYEAATSSYKRQLYAASTRGGSARGSWYGAFLREGDDWKRPFGAELTGEDRRALSSVGDSTGAPLPSGVRFVGAGKGSYAWDETDPAAPRWVFLGAGFGDYEVEFASVGAGRGAYADTLAAGGVRFYRYVGPTLGSYLPGRELAVPAAATIVDAGGAGRLGAFSVDGELARSSLDRNLLSSRDDGDNGGIAARGALRLDPRRLRLFGRNAGALRGDVTVRTTDASFTSFDRIDPAFEGERWNLSSTALGERRYEASLQYDASAGASVRGEWGRRRLSDGASATRRAAEALFRGFLTGSARWDEARNENVGGGEGLRSRVGLDLGRERGVIMPRIQAGAERVAGAEGDSVASRASRYASSSLVIAPSSAVRVRGGVAWRNDLEALPAGAAAAVSVSTGGALGDATADAGTRFLRSLAFDGGATVRADALTVDASLARRRVSGTTGDTNTDLAQVVMTGGKAGGSLTGEVRWDVSQVQEPERLRSLVPVGAGLGSYDATGTLAPGGGFEFVSTVGADATRTRAAWQVRLDAFPARGARTPAERRALWRAFGASTLLHLESESRLPLGRLERAFRFADYLSEASTIRGLSTGRQTLEFVPRGGAFEARAEGGVSREVVGDLQNLHVSRETRDMTFRTRHVLPVRFRLSERVSIDESRYESARSDTPDRTRTLLRGRGAELELSRAAGPQVNLSLIGRYRGDRDVQRAGTQETWSAGPAVSAAANGRLRLDARAFWGRTERTGTYAPPGSVLAPVLGQRIDYDLLSEWTLRDRLQLSLNWVGAAIPGRASTYNTRLELRSSF